jgi:hypothetical protein
MKSRYLLPVISLLTIFLYSCGIEFGPSTPVLEVPPIQSTPTEDFSALGLTEAEIKTLQSLEQIDEYPLYKMEYYADYETTSEFNNSRVENYLGSNRAWGCSLFAALADPENLLYGRNFDWEYSPALLLFTDPPDGYASVSMVDISYLGIMGDTANQLDSQPLGVIRNLLASPQLPFDGLNEKGLAVGMAAVPPGNIDSDPTKPTFGSLGIIREMLDHAANVDEAVDLMRGVNIDFGGGPPIHYLIADRNGDAVLVEYYQGEMHIFRNQQPWHLATNFLLSANESSGVGLCERYDAVNLRLEVNGGTLVPQGALDLLETVSQNSTQWSIVYNLASGEIHIAMGRNFDQVHLLQLEMPD